MSIELIYQWVILLLFGVGFYFVVPWSKTVEEFFSAYTKENKEPKLFILTTSLVISWIFAKSITNTANLSAEFGFVGGVAYAVYYISFIVAGLVIYQLRVQGGFRSIHHFLKSKFGNGALLVFSLLIGFRLFNEVWSNTMVIGNYFGEIGTNSYYLAIIVFTLLTLIYSLKGGLRSSLLTDAIQMVFFTVLLVLLLSFILPDKNTSVAEIVSSGEWKMSTGLNLLFAAFLQTLSYPFHDPVLTDRGFISKPAVTRKAFFIASVIGFLCICLFSFVGVYASQIGLVGDAAKSVGEKLGLFSMLAMNFIMVTSAASTLDSAFSSFSKLTVIDIFPKANPTIKKGRIAMIIIALAGTVPVFLQPEILSATTVSGTMVMGLAPVFLFWKSKGGPLAFHLPVWFGVLVGILLALGVFPELLVFTEGRYAQLLWANIWGLFGCVLLHKLALYVYHGKQ